MARAIRGMVCPLARFRLVTAMALGALFATSVSAVAEARRAKRAPLEFSVFGPSRPLTDTAWLVDGIGRNRRFQLASEPLLGLLERYVEPERDRTPEWRSFWRGRYGRKNWQLGAKLNWLNADNPVDASASFADSDAWLPFSELHPPAFEHPLDFAHADVLPDWALDVAAPEPEWFNIAARPYCPRWRAPRPVSVVRYDGAEWARLPLVDCAGAIAPDALDRLSSLARPPATPRPDFPLPLEPEEDASGGEWLPRVKLLHPRVIWAVEKIAEAFPNRSIFIMSGYRRDAHGSYHQKGRALDLYVAGVDNADLFRYCRTLNDVGCGYYPNNKFVHVDVRPFGTHRVAWVDVSEPGQASQYVTSWPGVFELSAAPQAE